MAQRHVFLVGFMGSGKTTVGEALARRLGRPFYDLDALIEAEAGQTASGIFEKQGESVFRRREAQMLRSTETFPPAVIALGGGAFISPANRRLVKSLGLSVWLRVSLEVAWNRCRKERHRPLAQSRTEFEKRFLERRPAYSRADLSVEVNDREIPEICEEIMKGLQNFTDFADFLRGSIRRDC